MGKLLLSQEKWIHERLHRHLCASVRQSFIREFHRFGMLTAVAMCDQFQGMASLSLVLAPERWSVEKKRRDWDQELQDFREKQRKRLKHIRQQSQAKVAQLHEKIFTTIRWSIPLLPSTYRKLVLEYCDHLMGPLPETPFLRWNVLIAWQKKFECSPEAKVTIEIQSLLEKLSQLVLKRDETLVKTLVNIDETTEKLTIAKEGGIKWHMETMPNKRDEYWTIWYLSRTGKADELKRFLSSCRDVDERDPDFGYTALHYACRWNQREAFDLLLEAGANILLTVPDDQRTSLHFASAYGTREMVLELLARGANYDGRDSFGNTALDLAIQNRNNSVANTLKNWLHLVPPDQCATEEEEELQEIPEEYLSTPYEVLLTMSAPLRVLTTRLEGVGKKHSLETDLPLEVELRLCEKRAELCAAEGFDREALRSKRRRWSSARREYLKTHRTDDSKSETETSRRNLTASFLSSICLELYAHLMLKRDFAAAMSVLSDGLITLQREKERGRRERIYLLTKYAELLLFHYDQRRSSSSSQTGEDELEVRYGDLERGQYADQSTTRPPTARRVLDMSEEEAVALIAHTSPAVGAPLFPSLLSTGPGPLRLSDLKDSNPKSLNQTAPAALVAFPSLFTRSNLFDETFPSLSPLEEPAKEATHDLLLVRLSRCVTEAIAIIEETFDQTDSFVESISLAPLLELLSDCYDRSVLSILSLSLTHRSG
jgi:hypothetical protein